MTSVKRLAIRLALAVVAPAGECHLNANGKLRKGVGDLHAEFSISAAC